MKNRNMKVTIKTIAKELGVSVGTVDRALHNRSEINEETKERVLTKLKEINYRPHGLARALALQRTDTIGLIVPDVKKPFYGELIQSIEQEAKERNYKIILGISDHEPSCTEMYVNLFQRDRTDGIIIISDQDNRDKTTFKKLKEEKFPVVIIGSTNGVKLDSITGDDVEGAYNLTRHLIEMGHKRIAYICGPTWLRSGRDRLEGYRKALQEVDINLDKNMVIESGLDEIDGYEAGRKILDITPKPTAIFALNDLLAMGVLKAINEKNLRVGEDIALVGFDNISFITFLDVPLTTVAFPKIEVGKMAMEMLLNKIRHEKLGRTQQIVLEPRIVIRESSKKDFS